MSIDNAYVGGASRTEAGRKKTRMGRGTNKHRPMLPEGEHLFQLCAQRSGNDLLAHALPSLVLQERLVLRKKAAYNRHPVGLSAQRLHEPRSGSIGADQH